MRRITFPAINRLPRCVGAFSLVAMLAACGGGSDSPPPSNTLTADEAKNASANTAAIPNDSVTALSAAIATAESVVGMGSAMVTANCPGGGSAVYSVTGPNAALLLNHQLDQGENYTLAFNNCRSANGASAVSGSMTLFVATRTADTISLNTATNNLLVSLPHGEVVLDGSSTITRTTQTAGNVTTVTTHWVTPSFNIVSHRNGRTTSFSYTDVDITRTVIYTNGQFTSASYSGTSTMTWVWPGGSFSLTFATQGTVGCTEDGTPTQGTIVITLPNNRITIAFVEGPGETTVTVAVDYGKDGTVDRIYTFTVTELMDGAG